MTGLFDTQKCNTILERMSKLNPQSKPLWGSMTVESMFAHHIAVLEVVLKIKPSAYPEGLTAKFLANPLGKWFVIYAPFPWPKGKVQAPPSFLRGKPVEFKMGYDRIQALINEFVTAGSSSDFGKSPFLGKLTSQQWSDLLHRHLDHHWQQFGV
jgi:hypothetical protein